MSLISKRLRALQKKYNRILQMEDSLSKGKTLNKEQQETLLTKQSILGAIEELKKIREPLSSALEEELQPPKLNSKDSHQIQENGFGEDERRGDEVVVQDLLNLLYFGSMFDVKSQGDFVSTMYRKNHERGCCLTYDYVTDDDADLLGEGDLDLISLLGDLVISRPVDSSFSHKDALQRCIEHAKLWIANSDQPVVPDSRITYATLREKLNKIMASDYFTTTPELKPSVDMVAAAENYQSFHVPVNGSVDANIPVEVEVPIVQQDHKEQGFENFQEPEVYVDQSSSEDQLRQDGSVVKNSTEFPSENASDVQLTEEQSQVYAESKEQQNGSRRSQNYRPGRGGGRRRNSNGYGGRDGSRGSYQNGDGQAGNYYPRNNYNYRGGRGGAGGNYNQASTQGGQ